MASTPETALRAAPPNVSIRLRIVFHVFRACSTPPQPCLSMPKGDRRLGNTDARKFDCALFDMPLYGLVSHRKSIAIFAVPFQLEVLL